MALTLIFSLVIWFSISHVQAGMALAALQTPLQQESSLPPQPMDELELQLLLGSGMNEDQCEAWRTICLVSSLGSFLGGIGAAILGPTALMCALDGYFDWSSC